MNPIPKQIVLDEANQPVAVQIAYEDWLRIEEFLRAHGERDERLSQFAGSIDWGEDAVAYQRRIRDEWEQRLDPS